MKNKSKNDLLKEIDILQKHISELENNISLKYKEKPCNKQDEKYDDLLLSSFLIHSPIYVFFKDSNIRSIRLSKNYEKMLCMPLEEALGKSMYDLFPSELAKSMVEDDKKILEKGEIVHVVEELDGRTYETTKFPILKNNKPIMLAGFTVDITDRKKAEEAFRKSEIRLRSLIENTSEAVFCYEFDQPIPINLPIDEQVKLMYECTLADCNLICAKSYGASSVNEVLGKKLRDLFGTTPDSLDELFRATINNNYRIIDGEGIEKLPDGSERYYLNNAYGIIENDKLMYMWGTFRDITERRKTEEELKNVQRLNSVGILAGGIAHDFNNLLSSLFGYIQLADRCIINNSQAKEYIEKALLVFSRTRDLTQQLLTFSKGGSPVKKVISVETIIRESIQLSLSGSNVDVKINILPDLPMIEADHGQMNQVFNNIFLNARQAMPNGGIIIIDVEGLKLDNNQIHTLNAGNYIRIIIKDQGIGIPDTLIDKIFDPFFTTKQAGSGLGLSTSYSIIKKHNGYIKIESEMGAGTAVFIYIPSTNIAKDYETEEHKIVVNNKGRILIMDDEEIILDVSVHIFSDLGIDVVCVKNGEEAIQSYKESLKNGNKYAAVILDLTVIGGMGGESTIKKLLEIDPEVKSIVSSGYSDSPVLANPQEYGFTARISKPYHINELTQVLNDVLKKDSYS